MQKSRIDEKIEGRMIMEVNEQDRQWLEKNHFLKMENEFKWTLTKDRIEITMVLENCGWFALAKGKFLDKIGAGQTAKKAFENLFFFLANDAIRQLGKMYELNDLFDEGLMSVVERFMLSRKKSDYLNKLDHCKKAEKPRYERLINEISERIEQLKQITKQESDNGK